MVAEREMLGRFIEHWYVMVWFIVVMMWIAITHYVEEKPNNSNNHNHDRTIRRLRVFHGQPLHLRHYNSSLFTLLTYCF
ncbi:hypothetical protein Lalb_Chr14g0374761 [Lupinus albus]|uniref:Uncharacterized protein n=1 Tax=Lupinus albus TaxID=3870 RepID=A0A6A4PGH9_LUPAL|nr:hypothetical protein Lalb_Chr14g0374761 [Lupinus albus]